MIVETLSWCMSANHAFDHPPKMMMRESFASKIITELSRAFGRSAFYYSPCSSTTDYHFFESTSNTYVSSTMRLPVRLPPSSKLPTEPPKIKYLNDGIEGTIIPVWFHFGVSCEISGSTHMFFSMSYRMMFENCDA